eukprot:scaffold171324_cov24-Tisochrysis_lutea.AAC.3
MTPSAAPGRLAALLAELTSSPAGVPSVLRLGEPICAAAASTAARARWSAESDLSASALSFSTTSASALAAACARTTSLCLATMASSSETFARSSAMALRSSSRRSSMRPSADMEGRERIAPTDRGRADGATRSPRASPPRARVR